MEREQQLMWIKQFKIALIEKDTKKLEELSHRMPEFQTLQEMQEALYLIKEAEEVLNALKKRTATAMQQLKNNIDFLKATEMAKHNRLDIIS